MSRAELEWEGTFAAWQNPEFGRIYSTYGSRKALRAHSMQWFVSHRPLVGNTTLYLYGASGDGDCVGAAERLAGQLKVGKLWIYSVHRLPAVRARVRMLPTLVMDLRPPTAELWETVGSKTRNMIRKGQKSGVAVRRAESGAEFEKWWTIHTDMARAKGIAKQNHALVRALFGNGELSALFLSLHDGRIIGGAFFLTVNYPVYWLGALDPRFKPLAPGYLNLWQAALEFKERGHRLLDLGGVDPQMRDGASLFKGGFSKKMVQGYVYEMPVCRWKYGLQTLLAGGTRVGDRARRTP